MSIDWEVDYRGVDAVIESYSCDKCKQVTEHDLTISFHDLFHPDSAGFDGEEGVWRYRIIIGPVPETDRLQTAKIALIDMIYIYHKVFPESDYVERKALLTTLEKTFQECICG